MQQAEPLYTAPGSCREFTVLELQANDIGCDCLKGYIVYSTTHFLFLYLGMAWSNKGVNSIFGATGSSSMYLVMTPTNKVNKPYLGLVSPLGIVHDSKTIVKQIICN